MTIREKALDKLLVNVDSLKTSVSENQQIKEIKAEYENSNGVFWVQYA